MKKSKRHILSICRMQLRRFRAHKLYEFFTKGVEDEFILEQYAWMFGEFITSSDVGVSMMLQSGNKVKRLRDEDSKSLSNQNIKLNTVDVT